MEIDEKEIKEHAKMLKEKGLTFQRKDVSEIANKSKGNLGYVDCPKCLNRGIIYFNSEDTGELRCYYCDCMKVRNAYKRMDEDGVLEQVRKSKFENFITKEAWQVKMKEVAKDFCDNLGRMFYIGGSSGCGKSHICSAILGTLTNKTVRLSRYMAWTSTIKRITRYQFEDKDLFEETMDMYMKAPILYIDDFLKPIGDKIPSTQQLSIAFDIIDYRYKNPKLITIISSEYWVEEIIQMDDALGSRIYEMSDKYRLKIKKDSSRNFRIYGDAEI